MIFAAGYVSFGETTEFGLALGISIGAQTVGDVLGVVQSLAATPSGRRMIVSVGVVAIGLLAVVILICAFDEGRRKWLTDAAKEAGALLASGGRVSLGAYAKLSHARFEGMMCLDAVAVPAERPLSGMVRAARILAGERGSLSTKELARRLWGYTRVPTSAVKKLHDQLSTCLAFLEIAPGEWQFSRRGALN